MPGGEIGRGGDRPGGRLEGIDLEGSDHATGQLRGLDGKATHLTNAPRRKPGARALSVAAQGRGGSGLAGLAAVTAGLDVAYPVPVLRYAAVPGPD